MTTTYSDNIGNYFSALGKNEDSAGTGLDQTFSTNTCDCFPKTLKISSAYKTIIHIHDERKNSYANVIAVCPKVLSLKFTNNWGTIDPFKLSGGSWIQAGVQTFGAENYSGPLDREVSSIHYWTGGSPISMVLTIQLYAESYEEVEDKIFKPLKILSNLAQPSTSEGGKLIQPGPSPFKFSIKYRGIKLKEVQTREKGTDKLIKSEYKEVVKDDGTALYTNYEISAGKGVQTDIKIGDWFYLTDILVEDVKINIPMNLAKHYRYTTGTKVQANQDIQNAKDTKETTQKNNNKRIDELNKYTEDNNKDIETLTSDKTKMSETRNTIRLLNDDIDATQKSIDNTTALMTESSKNEADYKAQAEKYTKMALTSKDIKKVSEYTTIANSSNRDAAINGKNAKVYQSELNQMNNTMSSLQSDKKAAETTLNDLTSKYGSEEKIQKRIDNKNAENKEYKEEKERLEKDTQKTNSEQNQIISDTNKKLSSDQLARPFMATIEMSIKTKYQITQEDFNKMLSGQPNNKQLIDWDLTNSSAGSAVADLVQRYTFVDGTDTEGRTTEVVYQEKSATTKAHDAVKNAKAKKK